MRFFWGGLTIALALACSPSDGPIPAGPGDGGGTAPGSLTVRVLDDGRLPYADASVRIRHADGYVDAMTDDDGVAVLEGVSLQLAESLVVSSNTQFTAYDGEFLRRELADESDSLELRLARLEPAVPQATISGTFANMVGAMPLVSALGHDFWFGEPGLDWSLTVDQGATVEVIAIDHEAGVDAYMGWKQTLVADGDISGLVIDFAEGVELERTMATLPIPKSPPLSNEHYGYVFVEPWSSRRERVSIAGFAPTMTLSADATSLDYEAVWVPVEQPLFTEHHIQGAHDVTAIATEGTPGNFAASWLAIPQLAVEDDMPLSWAETVDVGYADGDDVPSYLVAYVYDVDDQNLGTVWIAGGDRLALPPNLPQDVPDLLPPAPRLLEVLGGSGRVAHLPWERVSFSVRRHLVLP